MIQATDYEGIDIISANLSLFGAAWNLVREGGEDMTGRYRRFVKAGINNQTEDCICERYDYCIIDNPPDIGINVVNALGVTDEVIVPVKIDENALEGLDIVAGQIEDAKALNPSLTMKLPAASCGVSARDSLRSSLVCCAASCGELTPLWD